MTTDPLYTPPELGRAVERIELDIREIKQDVKAQGAVYITRGEYEAWRVGMDREVRDIKTALTNGLHDIRTDLKSSTPQWWVMLALGISALSALVAIFLAVTSA